MTDEYEVADENQVKILVDKINALNNKESNKSNMGKVGKNEEMIT